MATVSFSSYQSAILDWIVNGRGNLTVKATAGSGKTFTCKHASLILPSVNGGNTPPNASYLAFGRLNADEAKKAGFACDCATFHSFCFGKLRGYLKGKGIPMGYKQFNVDKRNVDRIIDTLWGDAIDEIRSVVVSLVGKAKSENYAPDAADSDLIALVDRYDLDWESADFTVRDVCTYTRKILAECMSIDGIRSRAGIDFDDMLWLVERFNVRLDTLDWLLVDEAQDTNVLQRAIMHRLVGPQTRIMAVGDDDQAIYAFRGASADALNLITEEFNCAELPLSISYRCSRAVVEFASAYGTIEAAPNAVDGAVIIPESFKLNDVRAYNLVLCRNNAPLISLAYKCIAAGIPAVVRGRDIGAGLISLVRKLAGKRGTLESLADKIGEYRTREVTQAEKARNDTKAQSINDRCDSLLAIIDNMSQDDVLRGVDGLVAAIGRLFTDVTDDSKLTLSTIHKAKGLEADHVLLLDWQLCDSRFDKRPDQKRTARAIKFVGATRAKLTNTLVTSEMIVTD